MKGFNQVVCRPPADVLAGGQRRIIRTQLKGLFMPLFRTGAALLGIVSARPADSFLDGEIRSIA
jgi:hypothetical protein